MSTPPSATVRYYIPTRPYDIIAAINRMTAATGSVQNARASSHADYNGHHVAVSWNSFRGYYVAEYQWGERVVLARGSLAACVEAAVAEYNRGALGASVSIVVKAEDAEDACLAPRLGIRLWTEEDETRERATWWTWKHDEVNSALRLNTTPYLIHARDRGEYDALCHPTRERWFRVEGRGFQYARRVVDQNHFLLWSETGEPLVLDLEQAAQWVKTLRDSAHRPLYPTPEAQQDLNLQFRHKVLSRLPVGRV